MRALRTLVLGNQVLVAALLALALLMKLAVPAGFMPTISDGRILVSVCSGTGPTTMVMTIPGVEHGKPDGDTRHDKAEQPCAFAGLSAPSLAAADPILLAAAILFVLILGTRPFAALVSTTPPHLRPPLRGPPARD